MVTCPAGRAVSGANSPMRASVCREVDDRGGHRVDEIGPGERAVDVGNHTFGEQVGAGAAAQREWCRRLRALDGDPFVARAQAVQHGGAHGAAHRVAGAERGRDGRRREHQAYDDEQAARPPPRRVADTEAEEHDVAQRERDE
jgi:hypothetical protein